MPFTAAHPAIILPLLKKRVFSVSGLIMGSMVPDFEFFLRMEAHGPYGHSLAGMFWLNIPIALGFITIYHNLVRNALIQHLPPYFEQKFQDFTSFKWNSYLKNNLQKVLFSVLIGNLSHLLWDAFTHFDGFFVSKLSFLTIEFEQIPMFLFLQYAFSLVGAIAIWLYIDKMPNSIIKNEFGLKTKIKYWLILSAVCALVFVLRFQNVPEFHFGERIVCLLSAFIAGLLVASFYAKTKLSKVSVLKKQSPDN